MRFPNNNNNDDGPQTANRQTIWLVSCCQLYDCLVQAIWSFFHLLSSSPLSSSSILIVDWRRRQTITRTRPNIRTITRKSRLLRGEKRCSATSFEQVARKQTSSRSLSLSRAEARGL